MRNISDWQAKSENTTANLSFSILLNCLNEPVCIIIKWLFGIPNKGQQSNNPQKILKHEAKADIEFRSSIYYSMLLNTEIRFHFNGLRLSNRVNWERMNHLHELIYLCIYILSLLYMHHTVENFMTWTHYSERATILKWLQTAAMSKWTDAVTFVQIAHNNSLQM